MPLGVGGGGRSVGRVILEPVGSCSRAPADGSPAPVKSAAHSAFSTAESQGHGACAELGSARPPSHPPKFWESLRRMHLSPPAQHPLHPTSGGWSSSQTESGCHLNRYCRRSDGEGEGDPTGSRRSLQLLPRAPEGARGRETAVPPARPGRGARRLPAARSPARLSLW